MSLWKKIVQSLKGDDSHTANHPVAQTAQDHADLANAVLEAREAAYAEFFGPLPEDILKIASLIGRWPGGGIYKIKAQQSADDKPVWIYISSGLSNPDIPVLEGENQVTHDEQGRVSEISANLQGSSETLPPYGFGYEIMVIAEEEADWPLLLLQWAIHAEFVHNIGLLSRIEQYQGVTVGDIPCADGQSIDLLIQKAQAPLPLSLNLPNGEIPLLVITAITAQELEWSLQNSRDALLKQLLASPVGQFSILHRDSVIE